LQVVTFPSAVAVHIDGASGRGSKRVSVGRGTSDNKALHHGLLLLEAIVTAEVMKRP
jgi:hypothetical protein